MAPPLAAILRRHLLLLPRLRLLLPAHHVRLSTSHFPSDESDFESDPDHSLPPAPYDDGELASFLHRLSSAASAASSTKDALSRLLSASSTGPSPESPSLLVRALWELRRDPDAAVLALRYGDQCCAVDAAEGEGAEPPPPPPAEAWHLAVWAAGKARRFDLAWAVVRRMRRRGVLTRRAMVILMERYAAANEVNKAIKTFDVMEKFKVEADQTVFYSLLRALCKSKNIEDAEELLLLRKKFFPLTAKGFNIILDGWCNMMSDVAEAKRVWREMSNYCITPDELHEGCTQYIQQTYR